MAQQRPSRSSSGGSGGGTRRGSDAALDDHAAANVAFVVDANPRCGDRGAAAASSSSAAPALSKADRDDNSKLPKRRKSIWRLIKLPPSIRDTFFDDFFSCAAAVSLFALAVTAAASFLGPSARPPHGAAWSLVLVWAAARAATALAAATGLPSPCFQLAAGVLLRNAASPRGLLSGLFGEGGEGNSSNARLAEGVRSAAASLIFVYGGLEIDPEVLVRTGEPAKLLLSSLAEAAAVAAAARWLFSMPPALACALGAVVKGAGPSLVVALAADVARRDDGGGGGGGGGDGRGAAAMTTPATTPAAGAATAAAAVAPRRPFSSSSSNHIQQRQQTQIQQQQTQQHQHHQRCGRARRTRLLKLLVGTAPLDEATSLVLFAALAGIALPAGGGAGRASSSSSSSQPPSSHHSWAVPPWAGGLVTLSLALAGSLAGALVLSATKLWNSPALLAAAAACVAAATKGCLELFGHQAAGDLASIGVGVLARVFWKRGFPWPLAAVSVSSFSDKRDGGESENEKKKTVAAVAVVPLVSDAAVSRARARLASVWFNVAAPAMLGLAGASVDLRQLDRRTASLAAGVVGCVIYEPWRD